MVHVPKTSWPPPFRVTRASHLTYNVRDLSRSREFYTEVLGLVVSDEDHYTVYLRGRGALSSQPRPQANQRGAGLHQDRRADL
jgi:catechol 2,3-dioxygenase-like lactoylglutathione lyase family enzyme